MAAAATAKGPSSVWYGVEAREFVQIFRNYSFFREL